MQLTRPAILQQAAVNRAITTSTALCYGGAAVLAVLAAVVFFRQGPAIQPGWIILFTAGVLGVSGVLLQQVWREQSSALLARQSHVEMLEAQLSQQRNAVDTLADGLDIALFICDDRGTIQYANRPALRLFRFDNPENRNLLAVTLSSELEQLVHRAGHLKEVQQAELTFADPIQLVGFAKAWPEDNGSRVFLSILDISDLRRLERVRRDFVSNVSHELRTPLTIIRSMAETLLDSPETPAAKKGQYLEKIMSEVDRLTFMANDLLVLTTAESQHVEKVSVDLADILQSVVEQLEKRAHEKSLKLRYEGPESLIAHVQAEQMRQVTLNLVENAINYTASGEVVVSLREEGAECVVSVKDTGSGIASDHLARIFERFYRVDRGRSRGTGGTGLGLSIVKHIVEAHGGTVSVESAHNVGSTFTVRIPM